MRPTRNRDLFVGLVFVSLCIPLDILASGHPPVQAIIPICGAVVALGKVLIGRR